MSILPRNRVLILSKKNIGRKLAVQQRQSLVLADNKALRYIPYPVLEIFQKIVPLSRITSKPGTILIEERKYSEYNVHSALKCMFFLFLCVLMLQGKK